MALTDIISTLFGSGAILGKIMLVRIIEYNKSLTYSRLAWPDSVRKGIRIMPRRVRAPSRKKKTPTYVQLS